MPGEHASVGLVILNDHRIVGFGPVKFLLTDEDAHAGTEPPLMAFFDSFAKAQQGSYAALYVGLRSQ